MHLAEFLSGPNKRRDRRRLRAKNATRTTDASFLRSHFSLCAPLGPRRGRERERERRPIPHHRRLHRVASVNRQKLLSIPRMYSTPPLPSPPFTLASSAPWTGTLLRIRYVNREDDNRTETDDGSRAGARSFEAPSPPPPSSSIHVFVRFLPSPRRWIRFFFALAIPPRSISSVP